MVKVSSPKRKQKDRLPDTQSKQPTSENCFIESCLDSVRFSENGKERQMLLIVAQILKIVLMCFVPVTLLLGSFLLVFTSPMGYRMTASSGLFVIVWIIMSIVVCYNFRVVFTNPAIADQARALTLLLWTLIASIIMARVYNRNFLKHVISLAKQRPPKESQFIIDRANSLNFIFAFETSLCGICSYLAYARMTLVRGSDEDILWFFGVVVLVMVLSGTSRAFLWVPHNVLANRQ
jgi:hypothetical protein